jgi:hypothetical protein
VRRTTRESGAPAGAGAAGPRPGGRVSARPLTASVPVIALACLVLLAVAAAAGGRRREAARPAPRAGFAGVVDGVSFWTIDGDQDASLFSYSASSAGDLNNDGYSDLILSAPLYDTVEGNAGCVFVYYGSASGPPVTPSWVMEGDQNAAELGASVACAGDVNGDGYDDVIIGSSHYDGSVIDMGKVYVFHGDSLGLPPTPAWTKMGDIAKAHLGFRVSGAGDVNADGYDDVIIGSFNYRNPDTKEGRAYVYLGSETGLLSTPAWIAEGNQAYAYFAYAVAGAGDVNDDGYDDVIVGACNYDVAGLENAGRAYVFHGDSAGVSPDAAWIVEGDQFNEYLGRSVAGAGDVNDDGYDDVIVGAPGYDGAGTDEGAAFVYLGGPGGVSATPVWTRTGGSSTAGFGDCVAGAGDINEDGFDEVAVGALGYDAGIGNEGAAYVYPGGPEGPSPSHMWWAVGDSVNAELGASVAGRLDVNDDGQLDLLAGAPGYPIEGERRGRLYVVSIGPDTTAPSVEILAPGGSETWYVGNTYEISWRAWDESGVDSVNISYSTDGGYEYSPVVGGHPNDGRYLWTVPDSPSEDVFLKVVAYDPGLLSGEDVTDAPLSVVRDVTGPAVEVLAPNGGETWYIGSEYEVYWTAEDVNGVDSVSVLVSFDGGWVYVPIASGLPNEPPYLWTVPDSTAKHAYLKVIAYDSKLNEGVDTSDRFFRIASDTVAPEITVLSPNGGESLEVGAPWEITWVSTDDNGVDSVSIYYSPDGGEGYVPVAPDEPNDSSYVWRPPSTLTEAALVRIIARDRAGNTAADECDYTFSIVPDTTGPDVEVVSPNGGEAWGIGGIKAIEWMAADPAGVDSVSIYYSADGGGTYNLIASGEPNDSVYLWSVPEAQSDSALVMVVAYDPSLNAGSDESDSLFVISPDIVDVPGASREPDEGPTLWGGTPNPFAGRTEIAFYLPAACAVRLAIFDAAGRRVARLIDGGIVGAGPHRISWDGTGDGGAPLPSGVYLCTLRTGEVIRARKVVLTR